MLMLGMKEKLDSASQVVIALDTSTASMSMAIVRGSKVLGEVQSMAERNHSVEVVSKLKQLMADCGVSAETLDAIAVGRGPGSYTGMRIGVTVAKTLAWAWSKPIVGVSSLEALAYGSAIGSAEAAGSGSAVPLDSEIGASTGTGASADADAGVGAGTNAGALGGQWFVPLMDARRGQVYTARFAVQPDGGWARLDEDGLRMMDGWVDALFAQAKSISAASTAGAASAACVAGAVGAASTASAASAAGAASTASAASAAGAAGATGAEAASAACVAGAVGAASAVGAAGAGAAGATGTEAASAANAASAAGSLHSLAITLCGDLSKHEAEAERLKQLCEAIGVSVALKTTIMEGRSVALLGADRAVRGEHEDVHGFVPNYTQLTEAEVKLRDKQAGA